MLPVAILPPEILPAAARWLDLAGLAVFAASGALAAAKRGQTFVTLIFFGLITGVGGGTVRDLLIDAPVFWIHDARAASMCLFVATVIWTTPARWWRDEALGWFDAVGLGDLNRDRIPDLVVSAATGETVYVIAGRKR